MAALTKDRSTLQRNVDSPLSSIFNLQVAAGVKIFKGALVAVNAAGFAVPGSTSTTLRVVGVSRAQVDNTAGGNGALQVQVERGSFYFLSLGGDPIVQASLFTDCFITDDATVSATNGGATKSRAGKVVDFDANGAWVETY